MNAATLSEAHLKLRPISITLNEAWIRLNPMETFYRQQNNARFVQALQQQMLSLENAILTYEKIFTDLANHLDHYITRAREILNPVNEEIDCVVDPDAALQKAKELELIKDTLRSKTIPNFPRVMLTMEKSLTNSDVNLNNKRPNSIYPVIQRILTLH
jgi:exonuclease VII small subunit